MAGHPAPAAATRTSGLAVTAMVLGILSLVPCVGMFIVLPALVFSIVSLVVLKNAQGKLSGRGMALTGLITSIVSALVLTGLMIYSVLEQRPKPFLVPAPHYTTLIGEGHAGRGFHFEHDGKRYLACSLHQFGNEAPNVMMSEQFDEPIEVTGQVHTQLDVQVLTYQSEQLDALPPLSYDPEPDLLAGYPIYLLDGSTAIKAHLDRPEFLTDNWIFVPENKGTFEAQARSGSPIVSGKTGKVIGVFLSADDTANATWGGFEELKLP